jgi:hypothetical protein
MNFDLKLVDRHPILEIAVEAVRILDKQRAHGGVLVKEPRPYESEDWFQARCSGEKDERRGLSRYPPHKGARQVRLGDFSVTEQRELSKRGIRVPTRSSVDR